MDDFKNDIIPDVESINGPVKTSVDGGTDIISNILKFVEDSIFSILAVIAIGVFIYIGYKFIKADGNPEEMKKAFMNLVHVILGIFVVSISWVAVKLVVGINF